MTIQEEISQVLRGFSNENSDVRSNAVLELAKIVESGEAKAVVDDSALLLLEKIVNNTRDIRFYIDKSIKMKTTVGAIARDAIEKINKAMKSTKQVERT
ncbi:MAG: hypothetical protein ACP5UL_06755 [Thermoplasmata archaeon]